MDGTSRTWDYSVTIIAVDCGIFSSCPTVDGTSRIWDYSVTIIAVDWDFSSCPTVDGTSRTWNYSVTIIAVDTMGFSPVVPLWMGHLRLGIAV